MTAGRYFLFLLFPVLLAACTGKSDSSPNNQSPEVRDAVGDYMLEPVSGKTAFDYFKDEGILVGWNLGNSLDSYSNGVGNETVWGNAPINQDIMNGVKAAGFDLIRIPITWMGHIGNAPDHTITPQRLKRVAEVVEMANKAGLKVIINLHHDGSTSSLTQEEGWLSIGKSYKNEDEYNRITHKFTRVWEQIAAYFQNYGDWLMFESMNEIHDGGWGWSGDFRTFPASQLVIINKWNQIFTDAVRKSGGNNTQRYLVIPAYCTNPQQTISPTFVLPNDSAPNKQVVTFHYYDPYEFGINSSRSEWGSPSDKQKVENDFSPFQGRFIDNKIPVIIGECGAVLQLFPNDSARQILARQSRFEYLPYIFTMAKKYNLVPVYWDNGSITGNGEKFGLFDRRTGIPNSDDSGELIKLMISSVK